MTTVETIEVSLTDVSGRLDRALADALPDLSRARVQALMSEGAISRDGALHESTDHGRTWRAVGRSPVPPGTGNGLSCSAIGCVLGPVVRLGWGAGAQEARLMTGARTPEQQASRAFAAEILAPIDYIRNAAGRGPISRGRIKSIADDLSVDPRVVQHQAENHKMALAG